MCITGHITREKTKLHNTNFGKEFPNYAVVFKGRLYNQKELEKRFYKKNQKVPLSIEEVILQGYMTWGKDLLLHLNGSFLLAIFDKTKEEFLIANDHFGKIPLYYSESQDGLYFSSNLKELISRYNISSEINPQALNFYLALRYIPNELCIYNHVKKLPPSHLLTYNPNSKLLTLEKYWEINTTDPPFQKDEKKLAFELEEILIKAVESRISQGLSNGAFLSGGVDSGLIVALMSSFMSSPVKTFTIGFKEPDFDESYNANIIASHYRTHHFSSIMDQSYMEHFDNIGKLLNEPLADPSVIPTYYACKLAASECQNMFCGEGADGLFLGLRTHKYTAIYSYFYPWLNPIAPILGSIGKRLPVNKKLKIIFEGLTPVQFFLRRIIINTPEERAKLLNPALKEHLGEKIHEPEQFVLSLLHSYSGSLKGKMAFYNSNTVLDNTLTMRASVTRFFNLNYSTPFLDPELVSFVFENIHPDLRIKSRRTKYILKEVAKKYLPRKLPIEKKRGFNPPFNKWFRDKWWEFACQIILDNNDMLINKEYAQKLLYKHKKQESDEGRKIFLLLTLRLWERENKLTI